MKCMNVGSIKCTCERYMHQKHGFYHRGSHWKMKINEFRVRHSYSSQHFHVKRLLPWGIPSPWLTAEQFHGQNCEILGGIISWANDIKRGTWILYFIIPFELALLKTGTFLKFFNAQSNWSFRLTVLNALALVIYITTSLLEIQKQEYGAYLKLGTLQQPSRLHSESEIFTRTRQEGVRLDTWIFGTSPFYWQADRQAESALIFDVVRLIGKHFLHKRIT